SPIPSNSPSVRLRQMKELAQDFSAKIFGWGNDPKKEREELRMLTKEYHRYEGQHPDILDGAVFAFVKGTDPEVTLQIEACKTEAGFQWQYAFSRRTSAELEGRLNGEVVWHVVTNVNNTNIHDTHLSVIHTLNLAKE